ncbi:MAG: hypothetical protein LBQ66_05460 [Planctomycetaceae bacterium]|jgi:hypothetical protein|nr:hypothetical protein [Planctomycetaceae bacterium]
MKNTQQPYPSSLTKICSNQKSVAARDGKQNSSASGQTCFLPHIGFDVFCKQNYRFFLSLILFAIVISFANISQVLAQNYKAWNVDNALSAKQADIMKAMKEGNAPSSAVRSEWNTFFDKYYFARWTVSANMGNIQTYSRDLISRDLKDSTGSARTFFLAKSLESLEKIAADRSVFPAARYNAILAIGQLNTKEQETNAAATVPPVPYEDALKKLISIYNDPKNRSLLDEYIRVGALLGIVRHAQAGIANNDLKNNVVPALLIKVITSNAPAADQDTEERAIKDWARLRAFDGLSAIKIATPSVIAAAEKVIADNAESFEMRCRAARLFGEIDLQSTTEIKATVYGRISNLIIILAKAYCDSEIARIDSLINKVQVQRTTNPARLGSGTRRPMPTITNPSGANVNDEIEEPPYADLPPAAQREILNIVQQIKSAVVHNIVFGIRGTKWSGPTANGILPVLKPDDPNSDKLNRASKTLMGLIDVLEKGKPNEKTGSASGTSTRPAPRPTTTTTTTRQPVKGQLKVNFTVTREALQDCSEKLADIIAGNREKPANAANTEKK